MAEEKNYVAELNRIAKENDLAGRVAAIVLNNLESDPTNETVQGWFEDLFKHGCISGMVSELIYYTDTHKFYDENYAEIEDLRHDWEENVTDHLQVGSDLKNWFAWFAFEETARSIAEELGLEA